MKTWTIALKDTLVRFRDRNAILLMIVAPLLISFVMGAAFGGLGDDTSPIYEIPLVIVNADEGELGENFVEIITGIEMDTSEGMKPLFLSTEMTDLGAAKTLIEQGEARGVVYIPAVFSDTLQQNPDNSGKQLVVVQVFTDPASTISPGIIRGVVSRIASGFSTVIIGNVVAINQLTNILENAASPSSPEVLTNLGNLENILNEENTSFAETEGPRERISVSSATVGTGEEFNLLNYFVPSMAIFFLMFAVFDGTQSILEEERDGTLHRMMTTPTSRAEIILGKISGAFLTGILQFVVLVLISGPIFGVDWGSDPLGMALLVIGTVAAATSLGAFIASFARTVNQAAVLGSTITLVFAMLGGNFIDYRALPEWLVPISKLTINRWAMEGISNLTFGGTGLAGVTLNIAVLFGLAAVFFVLSLILFNRRFVK
jgi:ABC-2 type transport system permease protein